MANFLNTRIRLKYDLYQNWYDKNPTLLEGEVAIAVPGDKLGTVDTAAACLMKVGNGTSAFRDLPWLAAPAADVHEWAKKSETAFREWLVSENGPHLANKSDLAALKSELLTEINGVRDSLNAYENALGFGAMEDKTVAEMITETYATKDEVNALNNRIGFVGDWENPDKTLCEMIEDNFATKDDLTNAIATEESRAKSAESALETAINTEKERAEAAEKVLTDAVAALNGEGEGSVDARIEAAIEAEAKARDAAILVETNARKGEITRVEGLISAEASRAAGVEEGLEGRIETIEKDYLKAADKTELQGNIDTLTGVVETLRDGVDADKVDGIKDLIDYVEEHGPEVVGMKEDIADNAAAIASEVARATEAEAAEAKARNDADVALGERIDEANTALTNYKVDIGFTKTDDKTLMQTIAATYATKTALNEAVADITELIEGINSDASGLEARVKANEDKLVGIGGEDQPATVVAAITAAEGRAAEDAQDKADAAQQAAITAAAADAQNKADAAKQAANAYTDSEIDKVESTIRTLQDFDKTAITGTKSGDVLTLALNGTALDIIFCCGNATV